MEHVVVVPALCKQHRDLHLHLHVLLLRGDGIDIGARYHCVLDRNRAQLQYVGDQRMFFRVDRFGLTGVLPNVMQGSGNSRLIG